MLLELTVRATFAIRGGIGTVTMKYLAVLQRQTPSLSRDREITLPPCTKVAILENVLCDSIIKRLR